MNKVLFRISAGVIFISLSMSVFLCIYVSPRAINMSEMSHAHVNIFPSHFDHIQLLTSAVIYKILLLTLILLCLLTGVLLVDISFSYTLSSLLYKEPPGMRHQLISSFVVNERAPPLD